MDADKIIRALSGAIWIGASVPDDGSAAASIHRCFRREAWREARFRDRLAMCVALPFVPLVTVLLAVIFTALNGRVIRRKTGKGIARQFVEQIALASRLAIPPPWYYIFELHDDARRRRAGDLLRRWEMKSGLYRFLRDYNGGLLCPEERSTPYLAEKGLFAARCREFGIATVPVLLIASSAGISSVDWKEPGLPNIDLFVKPAHGRGGEHATLWRCENGTQRFRSNQGDLVTAQDLLARLCKTARRRAFLVQPRLANHPQIADLANGVLATVRVMSCRNENGDFEVTDAVFRMARSPAVVVDNFHAGGIAARVDIGTGELGKATGGAWGATGAGWFERHPETGAQIERRKLPCWNESVELVQRAHQRAFPDQVVIGWDVAILPDGPCLVEANKGPDLDIIQRVGGTPLGTQRLGRLLAFNLRRAVEAKYELRYPAPELSVRGRDELQPSTEEAKR
jgi:Sugar-transfer associated ATP-grasp